MKITSYQPLQELLPKSELSGFTQWLGLRTPELASTSNRNLHKLVESRVNSMIDRHSYSQELFDLTQSYLAEERVELSSASEFTKLGNEVIEMVVKSTAKPTDPMHPMNMLVTFMTTNHDISVTDSPVAVKMQKVLLQLTEKDMTKAPKVFLAFQKGLNLSKKEMNSILRLFHKQNAKRLARTIPNPVKEMYTPKALDMIEAIGKSTTLSLGFELFLENNNVELDSTVIEYLNELNKPNVPKDKAVNLVKTIQKELLISPKIMNRYLENFEAVSKKLSKQAQLIEDTSPAEFNEGLDDTTPLDEMGYSVQTIGIISKLSRNNKLQTALKEYLPKKYRVQLEKNEDAFKDKIASQNTILELADKLRFNSEQMSELLEELNNMPSIDYDKMKDFKRVDLKEVKANLPKGIKENAMAIKSKDDSTFIYRLWTELSALYRRKLPKLVSSELAKMIKPNTLPVLNTTLKKVQALLGLKYPKVERAVLIALYPELYQNEPVEPVLDDDTDPTENDIGLDNIIKPNRQEPTDIPSPMDFKAPESRPVQDNIDDIITNLLNAPQNTKEQALDNLEQYLTKQGLYPENGDLDDLLIGSDSDVELLLQEVYEQATDTQKRVILNKLKVSVSDIGVDEVIEPIVDDIPTRQQDLDGTSQYEQVTKDNPYITPIEIDQTKFNPNILDKLDRAAKDSTYKKELISQLVSKHENTISELVVDSEIIGGVSIGVQFYDYLKGITGGDVQPAIESGIFSTLGGTRYSDSAPNWYALKEYMGLSDNGFNKLLLDLLMRMQNVEKFEKDNYFNELLELDVQPRFKPNTSIDNPYSKKLVDNLDQIGSNSTNLELFIKILRELKIDTDAVLADKPNLLISLENKLSATPDIVRKSYNEIKSNLTQSNELDKLEKLNQALTNIKFLTGNPAIDEDNTLGESMADKYSHFSQSDIKKLIDDNISTTPTNAENKQSNYSDTIQKFIDAGNIAPYRNTLNKFTVVGVDGDKALNLEQPIINWNEVDGSFSYDRELVISLEDNGLMKQANKFRDVYGALTRLNNQENKEKELDKDFRESIDENNYDVDATPEPTSAESKQGRLDVLEQSLVKKEKILQEKFDDYFATVKEANGQPLNDKGIKGRRTLDLWAKKSAGIRKQIEEIKKTKEAISTEKGLRDSVEDASDKYPEVIKLAIKQGILKVWRKYPNNFFVVGVDGDRDKGVKAPRIQWDDTTGKITNKYASGIRGLADKSQFNKFASVFNDLKGKIEIELGETESNIEFSKDILDFVKYNNNLVIDYFSSTYPNTADNPINEIQDIRDNKQLNFKLHEIKNKLGLSFETMTNDILSIKSKNSKLLDIQKQTDYSDTIQKLIDAGKITPYRKTLNKFTVVGVDGDKALKLKQPIIIWDEVDGSFSYDRELVISLEDNGLMKQANKFKDVYTELTELNDRENKEKELDKDFREAIGRDKFREILENPLKFKRYVMSKYTVSPLGENALNNIEVKPYNALENFLLHKVRKALNLSFSDMADVMLNFNIDENNYDDNISTTPTSADKEVFNPTLIKNLKDYPEGLKNELVKKLGIALPPEVSKIFFNIDSKTTKDQLNLALHDIKDLLGMSYDDMVGALAKSQEPKKEVEPETETDLGESIDNDRVLNSVPPSIKDLLVKYSNYDKYPSEFVASRINRDDRFKIPMTGTYLNVLHSELPSSLYSAVLDFMGGNEDKKVTDLVFKAVNDPKYDFLSPVSPIPEMYTKFSSNRRVFDEYPKLPQYIKNISSVYDIIQELNKAFTPTDYTKDYVQKLITSIFTDFYINTYDDRIKHKLSSVSFSGQNKENYTKQQQEKITELLANLKLVDGGFGIKDTKIYNLNGKQFSALMSNLLNANLKKKNELDWVIKKFNTINSEKDFYEKLGLLFSLYGKAKKEFFNMLDTELVNQETAKLDSYRLSKLSNRAIRNLYLLR